MENKEIDRQDLLEDGLPFEIGDFTRKNIREYVNCVFKQLSTTLGKPCKMIPEYLGLALEWCNNEEKKLANNTDPLSQRDANGIKSLKETIFDALLKYSEKLDKAEKTNLDYVCSYRTKIKRLVSCSYSGLNGRTQ